MPTIIHIETRFHCLYTLDFLFRINLINQNGELVGLGSLMTHLLPHEPANMLLSYLIEKNLFSDDALGVNEDKTFVLILSYIFTHLPFYMDQNRYQNLIEKRREEKFNSQVIFPEIDHMPQQFRQNLDEYNTLVLSVYKQYFTNVIHQLRLQFPDAEQFLPLSNINFKTYDVYDHGTFEYQLHHRYSWQNKTFLSPFSGVSGIDDDDYVKNYNSQSNDLAYDLDLSPQVIPFFQINDAYRCNSYAYDFYNHGSKKNLIDENQIPSSDIHILLNDFRLVLRKLQRSLRFLMRNANQFHDNETFDFFKSLSSKVERITRKYTTHFNKTMF